MSLNLFHRKKSEFSSEQDLITHAKKDSRYFAPIYEKYHEQIFRFVNQRMNNEEDASDLTSAVFLKVLINLNNYIDKGHPFSSWLYKIALNEVNQYYRKTNKQRVVNIDEKDLEDIIEETNDTFSHEKREKLIKTLANLADEKLTIIEMRFFEKRSFKEIAEVLNITENNAKVRTYRVLEEMKRNML